MQGPRATVPPAVAQREPSSTPPATGSPQCMSPASLCLCNSNRCKVPHPTAQVTTLPRKSRGWVRATQHTSGDEGCRYGWLQPPALSLVRVRGAHGLCPQATRGTWLPAQQAGGGPGRTHTGLAHADSSRGPWGERGAPDSRQSQRGAAPAPGQSGRMAHRSQGKRDFPPAQPRGAGDSAAPVARACDGAALLRPRQLLAGNRGSALPTGGPQRIWGAAPSLTGSLAPGSAKPSALRAPGLRQPRAPTPDGHVRLQPGTQAPRGCPAAPGKP